MNVSPIKSIYDNPEFFRKYIEYRKKPNNYTDNIIWPALCAVLPLIDGASIIDIGAGFGDFAVFAIKKGAATVMAIDSSRLMYAHANKRIMDLRIDYRLASVEDFEAPLGQFDLAISSMTFHYVSNLSLAFNKIYSWLKPGGFFVFSMNHPNYTAGLCDGAVNGWEKDGIQLIDNYFEEGERKHFWLVPGIIKYHVKLETIFNNLIGAGFTLEKVIEPALFKKFALEKPAMKNVTKTTFGLIVRAKKPPV